MTRWTLLIAILLAAGCSRAVVSSRPNPLEVQAGEYARLYDATLAVLRDQGFTIDRADYRFGRVTAHPLGSPTLMEPWHGGNTSLHQAAESTVNDQRRVVSVSLDPLDESRERYELAVTVEIERYQRPVRRLSGSTTGRNVFSNLRSVPAEWAARDIPAAYWRPIGRDELLEQRLMQAIVYRSVQPDHE